jgi:signal transduction histidine kinase
MTALDPMMEGAVAHATVGADGRLIAADPALAELNARAGGGVGHPLAVPQLATVARLAARLGIVVSRAVLVADEDVDLRLWARAQPEGGQVHLSVSGWREMPAWRPAASAPGLVPDADWRWETDAALRLSHVSLEAAAGAGLDAFALLGQPLTALFMLDTDEGGALPILDALARRRAFADQPARLRANGRQVVLSADLRLDADGDFAGLIGSARLAETDSETVAPALPASFTAGLDRALRKPLARIVANADSINAQADGPIASDYADYAADIANAGRHLLGLVDDLVDLQAIERPDFTLAVEPIDLADVGRRAVGLLAVRASQAGVIVEKPAPDAQCPARGDFRRALQIVVNLAGNALRYSPKGASVSVQVHCAEGRAKLIVADQGKGIAAEDQARIFDKFERIDPSEVGGNGLGLYIARRLARAMGGDLTVESAPGQGARFTFSLPA